MPRTVQFVCCAAVAVCGASFAGDSEGVARVQGEGRAHAAASSFGAWQAAPSTPEGVVKLRGIIPDAPTDGVVRVSRTAQQPAQSDLPVMTFKKESASTAEIRSALAPMSVMQPAIPALAASPSVLGVWSPVAASEGVASSRKTIHLPLNRSERDDVRMAAASTSPDRPAMPASPSAEESRRQITAALNVLSRHDQLAQNDIPVDPLAAPPAAQPELMGDVPSLDSVPESTERTMNNRLRMLNKPINSIALVEPPAADQDDPENVAKKVQGDLPAIGVWGAPWAVMAPQRYTYAFVHGPLYYQEVNLERCGQGHGAWQPVVSAADFLGRTIILPYLMTVNCPCGCEATLGDCPTCHQYPCGCGLPHGDELTELEGIAVEAAVIGGIVVLLSL